MTFKLSQLPVCLFAGAGGTGKTSVLDELRHAASARREKFVAMPSVTRDFYASKGITNESSMLDLCEQKRVMFQTDLFYFYCSQLVGNYRKALSYANEEDRPAFFVCDRSPYDHLSFLINVNPSMALSSYKQLLNTANNTLKQLNTDIHIAVFPYPASWTKENTGDDGFRALLAGKNIVIDALTTKLVSQAPEADSRIRSFTLSSYCSAKQRAQTVLINLQPVVKRHYDDLDD